MTQPGKFGLGGGGLVVGRSGAEPVTDDYPGERPWAFVGGTIKRVMIDVSGESFIDLAAEARAAFARQSLAEHPQTKLLDARAECVEQPVDLRLGRLVPDRHPDHARAWSGLSPCASSTWLGSLEPAARPTAATA